jgi:chitin-binding protein
MNKNKNKKILAGLAAGVAALIAAGVSAPAFAHGAAELPMSRSLGCSLEGWTPKSEACKSVVQSGGAPISDWQSVVVGDTYQGEKTPQYRASVKDGQLCSAGKPGFEALDGVHADWPTTALESGKDTVLKYKPTVKHQPYSFISYVTKDGWDQSKPLTWDALEETPFLVADSPEINGGSGTMSVDLPVVTPEGKSGKHVVYTIWQGNIKKDGSTQSTEAFFSCSDVTFK